MTVCPSGLRGWTQVPLAQAAWVQIQQLSCPCTCFLPRQASLSRIPDSHAVLRTSRMRSHETHGYCPTSQSDAAAVSRRRSAAHPHGATLLLSPRGAMLPKQTERYYFVSRECNASPAHGGTIRRANRTERSPMLPNLPERPTLLSSLTAALCCLS